MSTPWLTAVVGVHLSVCLAVYGYGFFAALWRRFRPARPGAVTAQGLGISVLKPLHGLDPSLEANLESFARLHAADPLEVLLLLDDVEDLAWPVACRVAERHPERFRVIIGTNRACANPKVGSLLHAVPHARHPLLWVTDSNVETSDGHLQSQLSTWSELQAGGRRPTLVHAPLAAVGGSGLGARCERLHLVSYNNLNAEVALLGGMNAVVGKSLLLHRDDLAKVGGFEAFANASGEDFLMGQAFAAIGAVGSSSEATRQVLGTHLGGYDFFERQSRWATLRRQMAGGSYYLLEHFTYFGISVLFAAAGVIPLRWLALAFGVKMVGDAIVTAAYTRQPPRLLDLLLLPVKELLLLGAWVFAMFSRQVVWRGRPLEVQKSGAYSTQPAKSDSPPQ